MKIAHQFQISGLFLGTQRSVASCMYIVASASLMDFLMYDYVMSVSDAGIDWRICISCLNSMSKVKYEHVETAILLLVWGMTTSA